MERQKSGIELIGRSPSRLAGAVSLLLAVCLIFGGVSPAVHAGSPPAMPHQFYGSVSLEGEPVDEDTLVEAFVAGVKQAQTTVDDQGRYGYDPVFTVPGTTGAEVTFYVGGVLANESSTWQSGKVQQLDLTINEEPAPPVPKYGLAMEATPVGGGNATDETGESPYIEGFEVSIKAVAATGYAFVNWTAPAGVFGNSTAELTTFAMPAQNVTVTANFQAVYNLTMSEDPAGSGQALDVDGKGVYPAGATVSIKAGPATGYGFINWTAQPPVEFADATADETTFIMPAQAATITANFEVVHELTMAKNPATGGDALDVGARGAYVAGATVTVRAIPAAGYGFVNWTSQPEVAFGNVTATETSFTMPGEAVTVTAHFQVVYALSLQRNPVHGGEAIDVGGKGAYPDGTTVTIRAEAAEGYRFVNWSAPPAVTLADAASEETTLSMPAQSVTVIANFEPAEGVPTVSTEAATGVTTYSANLNTSFTVGSSDEVELRFAVKRPTDPSWFHTPWESRQADGAYSYTLTGLSPQSEYDFKAQVKFNDTVIEGGVVRFATAQQPGAGVGFDLSRFGCFIATAAYGTPAAEQIDVLRDFRDDVLLGSALGSRFVALYYWLSPPVANVIAENGLLRTVVREILIEPVVRIVEATGGLWRQR